MSFFFSIYPLSLLLLACILSMPRIAGAAEVVDDLGRTVSISRPAERIVSLAPHLTELVYSAGAKNALVGVSLHCDYPPAVSSLPKISDHMSVNYELLTKLRPDLILVWGSGLKDVTLHKLVTLYNHVYVSNPTDFESIAENLIDIATLTGHSKSGRQTASQFLNEIDNIAMRYTDMPPVKTLYLVWHTPPMTVGGTHWISETLGLCNSINVFADATMDIVQINRESLQLLDMDIIVHSLQAYESRPEDLLSMLGLPASLPFYYIEDDLIQRPALRIARNADKLCRAVHRLQAAPNEDKTQSSTN